MEDDTNSGEWVVKEPDISWSSDCGGNRRGADLKAMFRFLSNATAMVRRGLSCGGLQGPGMCLGEDLHEA